MFFQISNKEKLVGQDQYLIFVSKYIVGRGRGEQNDCIVKVLSQSIIIAVIILCIYLFLITILIIFLPVIQQLKFENHCHMVPEQLSKWVASPGCQVCWGPNVSLESGLDGSCQQEAFRAWLEAEKACGAGGLRDAKKTNKDITQKIVSSFLWWAKPFVFFPLKYFKKFVFLQFHCFFCQERCTQVLSAAQRWVCSVSRGCKWRLGT